VDGGRESSNELPLPNWYSAAFCTLSMRPLPNRSAASSLHLSGAMSAVALRPGGLVANHASLQLRRCERPVSKELHSFWTFSAESCKISSYISEEEHLLRPPLPRLLVLGGVPPRQTVCTWTSWSKSRRPRRRPRTSAQHGDALLDWRNRLRRPGVCKGRSYRSYL
jgi:hypothetical protein